MGFIKCYAEKVDKWGRKCNIHLWDDEEGYNIYPFQKTYLALMNLTLPAYQKYLYNLNYAFLQLKNH